MSITFDTQYHATHNFQLCAYDTALFPLLSFVVLLHYPVWH